MIIRRLLGRGQRFSLSGAEALDSLLDQIQLELKLRAQLVSFEDFALVVLVGVRVGWVARLGAGRVERGAELGAGQAVATVDVITEALQHRHARVARGTGKRRLTAQRPAVKLADLHAHPRVVSRTTNDGQLGNKSATKPSIRVRIQSTLSNAGTLGNKTAVRLREVSALERVHAAWYPNHGFSTVCNDPTLTGCVLFSRLTEPNTPHKSFECLRIIALNISLIPEKLLSSDCATFGSVVSLRKHLLLSVLRGFWTKNKSMRCPPQRGVRLRYSSVTESRLQFGRDQICCAPKVGVHFREVSASRRGEGDEAHAQESDLDVATDRRRQQILEHAVGQADVRHDSHARRVHLLALRPRVDRQWRQVRAARDDDVSQLDRTAEVQ